MVRNRRSQSLVDINDVASAQLLSDTTAELQLVIINVYTSVHLPLCIGPDVSYSLGVALATVSR